MHTHVMALSCLSYNDLPMTMTIEYMPHNGHDSLGIFKQLVGNSYNSDNVIMFYKNQKYTIVIIILLPPQVPVSCSPLCASALVHYP